jgi:hypothetical protein
MKPERPDLSFRGLESAERTLIMYPPPPRPPSPTFDPASSTLRMADAPPHPEVTPSAAQAESVPEFQLSSPTIPTPMSFPPEPEPAARANAPSVPALSSDIDPTELEVALARLRRGRAPWALLGAIGTAAIIIASFAVFGQRSPSPHAAAAGGGAAARAVPATSREVALERERELRASRAAGKWVETPDAVRNAVPCDPSKPVAPGAPPCTPPAPASAPNP